MSVEHTLVRSQTFDIFLPTSFVDDGEQREREMKYRIVRNNSIREGLLSFGLDVLSICDNKSNDFLICVYHSIVSINNKYRLCNEDTIINYMNDIQWIEQFVIRALTAKRVSALTIHV
jgi:hypothetical protein